MRILKVNILFLVTTVSVFPFLHSQEPVNLREANTFYGHWKGEIKFAGLDKGQGINFSLAKGSSADKIVFITNPSQEGQKPDSVQCDFKDGVFLLKMEGRGKTGNDCKGELQFSLLDVNKMTASFFTETPDCERISFMGSRAENQVIASADFKGENKKLTSTKSGTISQNVKYLDFDEADFFFGRHAMVRKGNLQSFINDQGDIVLPFNKFRAAGESEGLGIASNLNGRAEGRLTFYPTQFGTLAHYNRDAKPVKYFSVLLEAPKFDDSERGFISPNSKWVFWSDVFNTKGTANLNPGMFSYDGYVLLGGNPSQYSATNGKWKFIRYDGKQFIGQGLRSKVATASSSEFRFENAEWFDGPTDGLTDWSCGLHPARYANYSESDVKDSRLLIERKNKRVGFVNRNGSFQIEPAFYAVSRFSEGMAFVCRLNEFGEPRWGAIDTLGRLIIPFKFTNLPGRFNNGRSLVKAVNVDKVEFAMIDKTGAIRFTIPRRSSDTVAVQSMRQGIWGSPGPEPFSYSHGYTVVSIDLYGSRRDNIFLLDTNGVYIPILKLLRQHFQGGEYLYIRSAVRDNLFLFEVKSNKKNGIGIADITGSIIIEPVFSKLRLFEPESTLQYAETMPSTASDKKIKGFIDRNGVFQFILKQPMGGY